MISRLPKETSGLDGIVFFGVEFTKNAGFLVLKN